jgi:hypothetical protein
MDILIRMEGATPLLMHNPQLADPENEVVREIGTLIHKRKKTSEDRKNVERLEWFGGLYLNSGRIVVPTANVRKCLIEAARVSRLGRNVERSLNFPEVDTPLEYDGPRELELLYKTGRYISRLAVVIGGKRTMRVRPRFMPWKVTVTGLYIEDAGLNYDELERIVKLAGQMEGLGDNRRNGYGRFAAIIAPAVAKVA